MSSLEHAGRAHALLSASGSERWINCPPSARMEEKLGFSETSIYAAEGTLAHEFAETKLRLSTLVEKSDGNARKQYDSRLTELRSSDLYTDEMEGQVEKYTDYVLEEWSVAKNKKNTPLLKIEEKVYLTEYIEDGFGTCDSIIICDGVMQIIDLKYGKGVKVSSTDNTQLKLYALGALRAYSLLFDIHSIKMTIVQPRLDHISSYEISSSDLVDWGLNVVKPVAKKAYEGSGDPKAGKWCRWCKVKARCKALCEHNTSIAKFEFKDPKLLDDKEILEVYNKINSLVFWANSVAEEMLDKALKGKKWDGYKVVEGRANRKWASETKAIDKLKTCGFSDSQILSNKIKPITQIEKVVGKSEFLSLGLTIKPQGKPVIVVDTDKRPAIGIQQAKQDFQ